MFEINAINLFFIIVIFCSIIANFCMNKYVHTHPRDLQTNAGVIVPLEKYIKTFGWTIFLCMIGQKLLQQNIVFTIIVLGILLLYMIRKFVDIILQKKLNAKLSEDEIIEKAAKKFNIDINNPIEKLTLTITYRNVYITKFYCSFIAFITTFVLTIFVFPII